MENDRSTIGRILIKAWLLVISLSLLLIGQVQIFQNPPIEWLIGGYAMLLAGLLLFILIGGIQSNPLQQSEPQSIVPHVRIGWFIAALALSLFTAWRSIGTPFPNFLFEQLLTWALALVALIAMVWESSPTGHSLRRWEYGLLIILFVGAFTVRAIRLDTAPAFLDQDEGTFAADGAQARLSQYALSPFSLFFDSYPRLYPALIGISSGVLGETIFSARLPSAILGALGIVALYLLGRELLGRSGGLVVALFALTWAFHAQLSRYALNQPADPLFATLGFYFLLRGFRRASSSDYVLSGIMFGLSQMFYLGGRVILIVIPVYLFVIWWRDRTLIRQHRRGLLLFVFAFFLVTLPQNFYLLVLHLPVTAHLSVTILNDTNLTPAYENPVFIGQQTIKAVSALFSTTDWDTVGWYGSGSNVMGIFGGWLLLIGIAVAIKVLWHNPQWSLPLLWGVATVIFGGILTQFPPQYQRYFPGAPAFALLVGMGVYAITAYVAKLSGTPQYRVPLLVMIGSLFLVANLLFYWDYYLPRGTYLYKVHNLIITKAAETMQAGYQAHRQVIFVGEYRSPLYDSPVIQYMMAGKPYISVPDNNPINLQQIDLTKPYVLIVNPHREADLQAILGQLPGGILSNVMLEKEGIVAFVEYTSVP